MTNINTTFPIPPVASMHAINQFRSVVTPHLSDNMDRLGGITSLQRFHRSKKMVGTAFTVKTRPGDNLAIYHALTVMQPGHVLVVDGANDIHNALVGDLILSYAQQRGCAGFVIDGAIRDSAAFFDADFPCYARCVSHRGPYKNGPGVLNVAVSVAGQVVNPGDIVVGDEDGIVIVPLNDADRLLAAAQRSALKEEAIREEISNGKIQQSWLEPFLASTAR